MLAGVEILLERMKTNPEEFVDGSHSKWSRVMSDGWDIFTEEERTALQNAHNEAKRERFNGEVMRVLSGDVEETTDDRYVKNLVKSATLTPSVLQQQIENTLSKQFDKAYAKREGGQVSWGDISPREMYGTKK